MIGPDLRGVEDVSISPLFNRKRKFISLRRNKFHLKGYPEARLEPEPPLRAMRALDHSAASASSENSVNASLYELKFLNIHGPRMWFTNHHPITPSPSRSNWRL